MLQIERKAHMAKFKSGLLHKKFGRDAQWRLDGMKKTYKGNYTSYHRMLFAGFHTFKCRLNRRMTINQLKYLPQFKKRVIRTKYSMVEKYKFRLR